MTGPKREPQMYEIWCMSADGASRLDVFPALGDDAAKMKAEVYFNLNPGIVRIKLFHSRRRSAESKLLELNR